MGFRCRYFCSEIRPSTLVRSYIRLTELLDPASTPLLDSLGVIYALADLVSVYCRGPIRCRSRRRSHPQWKLKSRQKTRLAEQGRWSRNHFRLAE
jgi:hypothetical protein